MGQRRWRSRVPGVTPGAGRPAVRFPRRSWPALPRPGCRPRGRGLDIGDRRGAAQAGSPGGLPLLWCCGGSACLERGRGGLPADTPAGQGGDRVGATPSSRPPVPRARSGCRRPARLACAAPPCASPQGDALGCRDVVPDFGRSPAASEVLSGGGDWLGERSGFLWLCPFLLSTPFLYVILPAGARRPVRLAWGWF